METNEYQTARIWKRTLKTLKIIAALSGSSIVETMDRLANQELARSQGCPRTAVPVLASNMTFEFGFFPLPKAICEIVLDEGGVLFLEHHGGYGEYRVVTAHDWKGDTEYHDAERLYADQRVILVINDGHILPNGNFDCQKIAEAIRQAM